MAFSWSADSISFVSFVALFASFGVIGNIIILLVYSIKKKNLLGEFLYIQVLAVSDLFVCGVLMPYTVFFEFRLVTNDVICRLLEIIRHTVVIFSNLILLVVAIDRFVMIWKVRSNITKRNKIWILLTTLLIVFVINIPTAVLFKVESDQNADNTTSSEYCQYTTSTLGDELGAVYRNFQSFIIALSMVLLMIIYVLVYALLYTRKKRMQNKIKNVGGTRGKISKENDREGTRGSEVQDNPKTSAVETTGGPDDNAMSASKKNPNSSNLKGTSHVRTKTWTMLFVCTLIFFISWIPFTIAIFNISEITIWRYFFFVSHASNPVVYSIINERVRASIKELFCDCRKI
ncbi:5-hydroxytryptamine receptor 2B-like [Ostrea edulis]|uniref:5-hydroxytryptamine receptor 2B-like n=1 Tax=Ostrea edulis TaxID=37623 RepID=UPI002095250B|nr:5-hydroxytryptamine receptor 2B-like [Ostrea edulis]